MVNQITGDPMANSLPPRVQDFLRRKTIVVISEYVEMLTSLHVLHRPEHHSYRAEWSQETLRQFPSRFVKKIKEFGTLTDEWLALIDSETPSTFNRPVEEAIHRLRNLPDAEFLVILYNQRFPLSTVVGWLTGTDNEWKEVLSETEKMALKNPVRIRKLIADFLEEYHRLYFHEEWRRVEPWIVRAEGAFYEKLNQNPIHALAELHPRLLVKEDALYAQKAVLYRFPYQDIRRILVRPSTFVHPHLLIGFSEGLVSVPFSVEVPGPSKSDDVPSDFVRMLKALSEETRLKIVRSLFQKPHCTQQLAQIHGISEAAVSKHLKLLMEANYVSTERRGNYVFYTLRPQEMEMILVYLRQFLEQ